MLYPRPSIVVALFAVLCITPHRIALARNPSAAPPSAAQAASPASPGSAAERIRLLNEELEKQFLAELEQLPAPAKEVPVAAAVDVHSRRGDLLMFLARFAEAEAAYRRMVELDPDLDASHWRLGIACFLANHPQAGADQFEKYHSFDSVDRENGIWRYFCHYRASGREAARKQLLRYDKDDRPPFREVYQLFQGTLSAEEVLSAATAAPDSSRQQRLFYSHLYVGLNAALEGNRTTAIDSLEQAALNEWPRSAGYGPRYMWHVGRLQLNQLLTPPVQKPAAPPADRN